MNQNSNLTLAVLENCMEFGKKVNSEIASIRQSNTNYIVPLCISRFSNGEGKAQIEDTVRDKDLYIISDVGNYSKTYMLHGYEHHVSPDEHFQDIKRVISATLRSCIKNNTGYATSLSIKAA